MKQSIDLKGGEKGTRWKDPSHGKNKQNNRTGTHHKRNYEQIQYSNSFNGKEEHEQIQYSNSFNGKEEHDQIQYSNSFNGKEHIK